MWAIYAIMASLWTCVYFFGNQAAKTSPNIFMVYRGVVPVLLLLPFIGLVHPIASWQFYFICILQGGVIAYIDYRNFRAIRVWGAEVISSIQPFNIGIVFVLWLLLKPHSIGRYLENPLHFALIVAALAGVVFAVSGYRKSQKSRRALKYMVPYLLVSAVCDALNKMAMSYVGADELIYASYFYILITAAVVAAVNLAIYLRSGNKIKQLAVSANLKYAIIIIPLMLSMLCKNFAMFNAINPSYVTATVYLFVVWIMLIGMLLKRLGRSGHYKNMDKSKVILLLVSVMILILFGR